MINIDFDVDLDVDPRIDIAAIFPTSVSASKVDAHDNLKQHQVARYFQRMAIDPTTKLAAIPYKEAAGCGYLKFDMLPLHTLSRFKSKEELRTLSHIDPDWALLEDELVVSKLSQINKQYNVVAAITPIDVVTLADTIAIIRPKKLRLLSPYLSDPVGTRPTLYARDKSDKTSYGKAHAIAYAHTIIAEMNLITLGRM